MAVSADYAWNAGTMKPPEFTWDFVDGLSFQVAVSISQDDVELGNFDVETTGSIDVSGNDSWPATGHFCIGGRVYVYTSISGSTFIGCYGVYGDQDFVPIVGGDTGYQAVVGTMVNLLLQRACAALAYQASSQSGLNISIAPFALFAGTTELTAYAGGTLALTDNATNYIYLYNNAGAAAVAKNTTSWASAASAAAGAILPLAIVVTSGGAITSWADKLPAKILNLPGGASISGAGTDNHLVLWNGTGAVDASLYSESGGIVTFDGGTYLTAFGLGRFYSYTPGASTVGHSFRGYSDSDDRLAIMGSGALRYGPGSAAYNAELGYISSGKIGMSSGDNFRVGDFGDGKLSPVLPANADTGFVIWYFNANGELCVLTDATVARNLNVVGSAHALLLPTSLGAGTTTDVTARTDNQIKFVHMGQSPDSITTIDIMCELTAAYTAGGAGTGAELAVFTGPVVVNGNATLTRVGYTNVASTFNSTGIKKTTVALSGVRARDELWIGYWDKTTAINGQAVFRALGSDRIQSGGVQTSTGAPSSNSSYSATLGAASLYGPWYAGKV